MMGLARFWARYSPMTSMKTGFGQPTMGGMLVPPRDLVTGHAFRRQELPERLVAVRVRGAGRYYRRTGERKAGHRRDIAVTDLRRRSGFRRHVDRPRATGDLGLARGAVRCTACARIPFPQPLIVINEIYFGSLIVLKFVWFSSKFSSLMMSLR
jgi:hypothetical protein